MAKIRDAGVTVKISPFRCSDISASAFMLDKTEIMASSPYARSWTSIDSEIRAHAKDACRNGSAPQAARFRRSLGKGSAWTVSWTANGVQYTQCGPRRYVLLARFNPIRRLRSVLEGARLLRPFLPAIDDAQGNVIAPGALVDIDQADLPGMVLTEAANIVDEVAAAYRCSLGDVLGIEDTVPINVSLTRSEIAWDIPTRDPKALIQSYARPVTWCLLRRPRPSNGSSGRPLPLVYAVVGGAYPREDGVHRLRFIAYEKLPATADHDGLVRLEFRLDKNLVTRFRGTPVLPTDHAGIRTAFSALADHVNPFLRAMNMDRKAAQARITLKDYARLVGGIRSFARLHDLLGRLLEDGLVRVTPGNRRHIVRLERVGWVTRPPFSRPPYRRLAPGLDSAVRALLCAQFPSSTVVAGVPDLVVPSEKP